MASSRSIYKIRIILVLICKDYEVSKIDSSSSICPGHCTLPYSPKQVITWTAEEVADGARKYLYFRYEHQVALLIQAKLNGRKLLSINTIEELMIKVNLVNGPASKLWNAIKKLKNQLSQPGMHK